MSRLRSYDLARILACATLGTAGCAVPSLRRTCGRAGGGWSSVVVRSSALTKYLRGGDELFRSEGRAVAHWKAISWPSWRSCGQVLLRTPFDSRRWEAPETHRCIFAQQSTTCPKLRPPRRRWSPLPPPSPPPLPDPLSSPRVCLAPLSRALTPHKRYANATPSHAWAPPSLARARTRDTCSLLLHPSARLPP